MNFLKNTEDIQDSLGNGGSRDQYRDKKSKDEDTGIMNIQTHLDL